MTSAENLASTTLVFHRRLILGLFLSCTLAASVPPIRAQQQGPLPPPPASGSSGSPGMGNSDAGSAAEKTATHTESTITNEPPAIPAEQIIQKFSQHESEFRKERDNYTYTQTFVFQTLDFDNNPDGEYRLTTDVSFTPEGKRYEHDTYAPAPTITKLLFTKQDLDDLKNIQVVEVLFGEQQLGDGGSRSVGVVPKKI